MTTTRTGPSSALTTVTARTPEDLLALSPAVLGFWPEESVVMLTLGAARPFHGRLDLPPREVQVPGVLHEVERRLLDPAARLGATHVVLIYYTVDDGAVPRVHRALRRGLRRRGLGTAEVLVADGTHYRRLSDPEVERRALSRPYDVSVHPWVIEAIAAGRLRHGSRRALVDSLAQDAAAAARIETAVVAQGWADAGIPVDGRSLRVEGAWVREALGRLVASQEPAEDAVVARLLWMLQADVVRDAAWSLQSRREAGAHVAVWSDLLRRAPSDLAAAPAALLGWAAWQAGDGATAWVAHDRCRAADRAYRLADHLEAILRGAVPPEEWEGDFDWAAGLPEAAG